MGNPAARLKAIDRAQTYWGEVDLGSLIAEDHRARAVWAWIEQQPVDLFLETNQSVEGGAGAERTDPRLRISVWVYGLTLGIGAGRERERRMSQEPGLRWLSGDQTINITRCRISGCNMCWRC